MANRGLSGPKIVFLVCVGVVTVIAIIGSTQKDGNKDGRQSKAIALIRSRYTPSAQLLMMNPDFERSTWVAAEYPLCDDKSADCWKVVADVTVMDGATKKDVSAAWIIDLNGKRDAPSNTEARVMYQLNPGTTSSQSQPSAR